MKKQQNDYDYQEKKLMEKHPELRALKCISINHPSLRMGSLAKFIEMCWQNDYGNENRILFTTKFLKWGMGEKPEGNVAITKEGKIVGALICLERNYNHNGKQIQYAIKTALSVQNEYRGQGIAQWISVKLKRTLMKKNFDFSMVWYDTRHNHSESSFQLLGLKKPSPHGLMPIRIMSRMFDFKKAVDNVPFRPTEKVIIKAQTLWSHHFYNAGLPKAFCIKNFSHDDMEAYMNFLIAYQNKKGFKFAPTKTDLFRWQKDAYESAGFYSLIQKGKSGGNQVKALYFGHKVRVEQGYYYFHADGILLCPDLGKSVARSFLRNVEYRLHKNEACFGTIVPETGGGLYLNRFGYRYLVHQHLGMELYRSLDITLTDLKKGWLELR